MRRKMGVRVSAFILILCTVGLAARTVDGSTNVVINEFELNPPGDDYAPGAEFVELYNPTSLPVDISGWTVSSTHGVPVTLKIPPGTTIPPKGFHIVTHTTQWLDNTDEQIVLKNAANVEIDGTPAKSDPFNDARTWQRYPDGSVDWVFDTATRFAINIRSLRRQC
jgi:hypothetical protein